MERFNIEIKSSVKKEIARISSQFIPQIIHSIEKLSLNPYPAGSKKLTGSKSSYRLRAGDYRIIYKIEKSGKKVIIYHVKHRKDAYGKK